MLKAVPIILILIGLIKSQRLFAADDALHIRSQTIAQLFRSSFHPIHHRPLAPGDSIIRMGATVANYWGQDKGYVVDGQSTDEQVQMRFGLWQNLNLSLEFGQRRFVGLPMDDVSIGFHDTFGIGQDKRLLVPHNRNMVAVPRYGIAITSEDEGKLVSQQAAFKVEAAAMRLMGMEIMVAVQLSQEYADSSLIRKGARDIGGQVGIARQGDYGSTFANFNVMDYDGSQEARVYLRTRIHSLMFGHSYPFSQDQRIILQALISESPFREMGQLSKESWELHLGFRQRWSKLETELVLIENIIWPFNTPDWGLSFNISYRIPQAS